MNKNISTKAIEEMLNKLIPSCLILSITVFYILYHFQIENGLWSKQDTYQGQEAFYTDLHNDVRENNQLERDTRIQEGIAKEILRFHVIANSDSKEDQALKLKVKEAVTSALKPKLSEASSVKEAREILKKELDSLEELSNRIIQEHGFTYTASASIEKGYFPLKVYGDLTLPPGEYEAVRIELGSASGQNWWCIMFPPLCFVDTTYSVIPESSKEELKYVLTEEEYDALFSERNKEEKVKVKVSFKLFSWLNKWIDN